MEHHGQIQPSVFVGPAVWHTLKCYAATYEPSERNRQRYKEWIRLTIELFPCEICREHALSTWRKHNIDNYLQNRDRLYLYISGLLQDGANEYKGIPIEQRPNYYEAKQFIFESLHGSCESCHTH